MLFLMLAFTLVFLELAVRFVRPQPEFYPRYRYSERYGHLLRESSTIINQVPGSWRFVYHTNEYGYRVSMPQVSNRYDRPNIVVLGDSNTFGVGVDDGDEYPAVLAKLMAGRADLVNLAVGGFGLTQEIRTFYEFGLLFQPRAVVLQFAANDPDDNIYEKVTHIEDGRFHFVPMSSMGGRIGRVKDWLGSSVLQHSAVYNLFRDYAFDIWRKRAVERESGEDRHRKETFHNDLLMIFAKDLQRRGIPLILIATPGDLARWPGVRAQVELMDHAGLLSYLNTDKWFAAESDYRTPQGHAWGAKGHRIVADHLIGPLLPLVAEQIPSVTDELISTAARVDAHEEAAQH